MCAFTLRWLGTGSGMNPRLGNTAFLAINGSARLLGDCGATAFTRLVESGEIAGVRDVLVTHLHADHIGGLEMFGFYHHFVLNRRGPDRPRLYVATAKLAEDLWHGALRAGMEMFQLDDGSSIAVGLDTYFDIVVGAEVSVPGLPTITFTPARHVVGMENYALRFDNGVFYSGDTTELPPHDAEHIFQDCRFGEPFAGQIHITYRELKDALPPQVRRRMHLVHLDEGHEAFNPHADGFAGFVMPGQEFTLT